MSVRSDSPKSCVNSKPDLLGALSASQLKAFNDLKDLCEKNARFWTKSKTESKSSPDVSDDVTLLRYLRARNYDPQAAFKQYSTTASWRKTLQLNDTYDNVEVSNFESTRRLFPQWTGRRSKTGTPIFVYVVSEIRSEDLIATCERDPDLSSIFLPAEHATQFVYPLCGRMHPDGVVSSAFNIIDLSGVGVRLFWNLRRLLQKSSTMATAHYPETVDKIFVVGAPAFFPTIWGFVTKWFEPATTSKIFILAASEVKSALTKYVDVDDLPKRFGGNHEWEVGMHPLPDEEVKRLVGETVVDSVEGPIRYIAGAEKDVIMAVGAEEGKERREVLATLAVRDMSTEIIVEKSSSPDIDIIA